MAALLYYIEQEVRSGNINFSHSTFSQMGRSCFVQKTGRILQKYHMETVKANFLVKAAGWVGAPECDEDSPYPPPEYYEFDEEDSSPPENLEFDEEDYSPPPPPPPKKVG